MGFFDKIRQAIRPSDPELRIPEIQTPEITPEPVKESDPVPAVVVQPAPVADEVKPVPTIGSSLRKKPLLSDEDLARIKAKTDRKKQAAEARKQKKQAKLAPVTLAPVPDSLVPVIPAPIVKADEAPQLVGHRWKPGESGNPAGRPKTKHVKDALEKIIAQAKASNTTDPLVATRLEALVHKIYEMAMDPDAELDEVLEAAKFISERLEGKPASDVDESGSQKPALTININATRFPVQPVIEQGEVINVESV